MSAWKVVVKKEGGAGKKRQRMNGGTGGAPERSSGIKERSLVVIKFSGIYTILYQG